MFEPNTQVMTRRWFPFLLIGGAGPFILLTFMIVFQSDSYQYWGDKYHSVLSSQYLFSRLEGGSLISPLWREDIFSGNIWFVTLGATVPFMVDTTVARLLHLSPVSIDLVSNLIGYFVAAGAMYLYLRRVVETTSESAAVCAMLFAATAYILSVWTGCANDFSTTGLLPALLLMSHQVKVASDRGSRDAIILAWVRLSLLVYACALVSSVKTLPVLLMLVMAYVVFVFRSVRVVVPVILALMTGILLYSPWLWLSWGAARISQRLQLSFVPPASFEMQNLIHQILVVLKRVASGFNVYGISMPVILVIAGAFLGLREGFKRAGSGVKSILQFSVLAFVVCFSMDAFASQVNDLKRGLPFVSGFDVVRFEWFVSFFTLVPVAWLLDNAIGRSVVGGSLPVTSRPLRWAVAVTAILFVLQAAHITSRTLHVPSSIYPQNLLLVLYLVLYVALSLSVLILVHRGVGDRPDTYRMWCLSLMALSVLFQASVIGYRQGVESVNRTNGDEPIMTYAQRFSVPDDITMLKAVNHSSDRVLDLTRPFDRVLTTSGSTVLALAGLRTPAGYTSTFPSWYDRFVALGINGTPDRPSRWVEVKAGPNTNFGALQLLGVKYVLAYDGTDMPGYAPLRRLDRTGKTIYEAQLSVGPAFLSPESSCIQNDREALDAIHAADYRALVGRAILVRSDPSAQPFCRNTTTISRGIEPLPARIRVQRGNDAVSVEVQSETGGVLTLADTYYPGWKGFVDGMEVPILRTYTTFRGVWLDPGRHTVEFLFSPTPFWNLFWLSNGLLAALLMLTAWARWKVGKILPVSYGQASVQQQTK